MKNCGTETTARFVCPAPVLVVSHSDFCGSGFSLSSDKEDEFFIAGVYSYVLDRNKK